MHSQTATKFFSKVRDTFSRTKAHIKRHFHARRSMRGRWSSNVSNALLRVNKPQTMSPIIIPVTTKYSSAMTQKASIVSRNFAIRETNTTHNKDALSNHTATTNIPEAKSAWHSLYILFEKTIFLRLISMLYFTVTSKSLVQQQRTRPAPQVLPGPAITNKPSKYARECELDIDSLYCKNGPLMIVFPTGEEEGEGEDGFTYNKEDRHQNRDCKIRFEDRVSFFLLQAKHKMKFELLELRCRMRYIRHRCHEKMLSRECHVVLENNF